MKKKLLGITALFAVLAMAFAFSACDLSNLGGGLDKEDGAERTVNFENYSNAKITITCKGSTPSSVELAKAPRQGECSRASVKRAGIIMIDSIAITDPANVPDAWNYIELGGGLAPADKQGKNGMKLEGGTLAFYAARTGDFNPIGWKIAVLDE